jgi:arylsulfatase A-like enzyme
MEKMILVVIDALRRDRVGIMSGGATLTPNIDALAEDGVIFENAFTAANATDPSVTSIHSGYDPSAVVLHHGPNVTEDEKRRAESVVSVPERLQANGIRTVAAGRSLARWHSSGFDEYPEEVIGDYERRWIERQLNRLSPKLKPIAQRLYGMVSKLKNDVYSDDEVDRLLNLLTDSRCYGFLHIMDTHVPHNPDPDIIERLLNHREYCNQNLQEFFETHMDYPYISDYLRETATDADFEAGLARLFARYDGAVVEADQKVGRLVEGLRDRDYLSDTTIIITSDHGESLNEHGIYFDHHGLYGPSVRVPLIISGSDIPDNKREEYVSLFDVAPTISEHFEVEPDGDMSGQSLFSLWDQDGEWRKREFVIFHEAQAQRRIGIRTGRYKLIKHVSDPVLEEKHGSSLECGYCDIIHGNERELYDLHKDPLETTNIVEQQPEVAAKLESKVDAYLNNIDQVESETKSQIVYNNQDKVIERLEQLGYK